MSEAEKTRFVGMSTSLAKSDLQRKIANDFGEDAYDELARKDKKGSNEMMNYISNMEKMIQKIIEK